MIISSTAQKNFAQRLKEENLVLGREKITTLQVNIGKRCNQACHHCHVESGPDRTENMEKATLDRLLQLIDAQTDIETVDITGGAPELNPHFRYFVSELRKRNLHVIDRCNLTILFEPDQESTAAFLADNEVEVVASLPCYLEDNVDGQRGKGVFQKSINALKQLNALGYGQPDSSRILNLVYNPTGIHLPPSQSELQNDYKKFLQENFGIQFNQLYTITNMPIKRFAHQLEREGRHEEYMALLIDNFNANAVNYVMCKHQLSIGWDGKIYDCDFNQMLELPASDMNIFSIRSFNDINPKIKVADHCYACTAGSGSSCGGALA